MQKKGKIAAIIQARMGSSRLPGKAMSDLCGVPAIKLMCDRLNNCKSLDQIIVATSTNNTDDVLCDFLAKNNTKYFRGNEDDVLRRVIEAAKINKINHIVRLTGDCPLIDYSIVDKCISEYLQDENLDYISSTTLSPKYPRGQDVEVFSLKSLMLVNDYVLDDKFREHVSLYIYTDGVNRFGFSCKSCSPTTYHINKDIRVTLDYPEDYELIKKIIEQLGHNCTLKEIIELLNKKPKLIDLNKKCAEQASYPNDYIRDSARFPA
jgi:spore coat polysaccharide biosynthesis protein SpsF